MFIVKLLFSMTMKNGDFEVEKLVSFEVEKFGILTYDFSFSKFFIHFRKYFRKKNYRCTLQNSLIKLLKHFKTVKISKLQVYRSLCH